MLTDEQVEYFKSGMLYVNVHTEAVVRSAGASGKIAAAVLSILLPPHDRKPSCAKFGNRNGGLAATAVLTSIRDQKQKNARRGNVGRAKSGGPARSDVKPKPPLSQGLVSGSYEVAWAGSVLLAKAGASVLPNVR